MEQIKGTVESLLKGLKARAAVGDAGDVLAGMLTKKELAHLRVQPSRGGKLRIAVDSSAWLYYFNLRRKQLLEKISSSLPGIKEISFFIGDVEPGKKRAPGN